MNAGFTVGRLRRRLTLEQPVDIADGAGGFLRAFQPITQVWGVVSPTGGSARFVEGQPEQVVTHVVVIRWRPDVVEGMRFTGVGSPLLVQAAFDAVDTRRFLKCLCAQTR